MDEVNKGREKEHRTVSLEDMGERKREGETEIDRGDKEKQKNSQCKGLPLQRSRGKVREGMGGTCLLKKPFVAV